MKAQKIPGQGQVIQKKYEKTKKYSAKKSVEKTQG